MNPKYRTAVEAAGKPGMPKKPQGVTRRAAREGYTWRWRSGRGGGKEYLETCFPEVTQAAWRLEEQRAALLDSEVAVAKPAIKYESTVLWGNYERQPQKGKDKAKKKLAAAVEADSLIEFGMPRATVWKMVGRKHDMSERNVRRSWTDVQPYHRSDWLAVLAPGHRGGPNKTTIDPRVWNVVEADYLRLEQPAFTACYRRAERICTAKGWSLPSEATIRRRIADIPVTVRTLLREGEQALMRLYPPMERDVSQLYALQAISGDGYTHNIFAIWPDGTVGRPHTWFWQDGHSCKLLAWRVDPTENTDMIRLSFGDVIEEGIPDHVVIDNTRAAAGKWLSGGIRTRYRFTVRDDDPLGIFPMLGVTVHWTSVHNGRGHGQAKPIERAFGIGGIGEVVDKHPAFAGAWCGNNPTSKPENYASRAIPIETFLRVLKEEIAAYNARPKRRTQMCRNLHSFDQVFQASYERSPIRKATAEQRRMCLLPAESLRVKRDGTFTLAAGRATGLGRNRYQADCLLELAGEKIVARFDPQDLHGFVHAYRLNGEYLGEAQCIDPAGFIDTQRGREHNRARRQMMKATKQAARAELKMTALEVADQLPQTEVPDRVKSKVVKAFRPPKDIVRNPPPKQHLTAEQKADLGRLAEEMERERNSAPVVSLRDMTPKQLFMRCERIFEQIERGDSVSAEDMQWARGYHGSSEYQAMQMMDQDFDFLNRQETSK